MTPPVIGFCLTPIHSPKEMLIGSGSVAGVLTGIIGVIRCSDGETLKSKETNMDEVTILHFLNDKHQEYIVIQTDESPPEDYCRPGFRLHGTHKAEIDDAITLPCNSELTK
jgi:hypothetical protein